MQIRHQATQWLGALAGALALHAAALWLLQHRPTTPLQVTAPHAAARVLHVNVIPGARPHAVIAPPMPAAPEPAAPPPTPAPAPRPADVQPVTLSATKRAEAPRPLIPASHGTPAAPVVPETPFEAVEAPPPSNQPTPAPNANREPLWLDANQADSSPTPDDNRWLLADRPWPHSFARVQLKVWVSAQGRIERFELEGTAADDPAMRELFAPIVNTPMRPARLGDISVPSVMRLEMWPGNEVVPEFVAPLAPESAATRLRN